MIGTALRRSKLLTLLRRDDNNVSTATVLDGTISFLGDSITNNMGADLTVYFGAKAASWENDGVDGNETRQVIARVDDDVTGVDTCVILIGINDIAQSVTQATYQNNIEECVTRIAVRGIQPVLCTIMPLGTDYVGYEAINATVVTWNSWITSYCSTEGLVCIDMYTAFLDGTAGNSALYESDDVHPNATGYGVFAATVEAALNVAPSPKTYSALLPSATAYWKVNDYSGSGNLLDGSGNGHHATPNNNPVYNASGYFEMTAASEQDFSVSDHANLDFAAADSFTIVFVGDLTDGGGYHSMVSKRTALGTADVGYYFCKDINERLRIEISDGTAEVLDTTNILAWNLGRQTYMGIRNVSTDTLLSYTYKEVRATTTDTTTGTLANANSLYLCSLNGDFYWWAGKFYGAAIFRSALTVPECIRVGAELIS